MFRFAFDRDQILLHVVQQGYWTLAEFRAFEAEFLTLHATIRKTSPSYRVMADCHDFPVQSAEISEAFRIMFEKLMAENHGRYAIVIGSILNKLQAKRALPQPNVQVFADPDEAMRWLEGGALHG